MSRLAVTPSMAGRWSTHRASHQAPVATLLELGQAEPPLWGGGPELLEIYEEGANFDPYPVLIKLCFEFVEMKRNDQELIMICIRKI